MSGSPYQNIPIANGTSKTVSSSNSSMDPFGKTDRISDEIRKMEEENIMFREEFRMIRDQIYAIRSVLGMERPPAGTVMKLSSALKELAVEIDKRADIFGNIDPAMRL